MTISSMKCIECGTFLVKNAKGYICPKCKEQRIVSTGGGASIKIDGKKM